MIATAQLFFGDSPSPAPPTSGHVHRTQTDCLGSTSGNHQTHSLTSARKLHQISHLKSHTTDKRASLFGAWTELAEASPAALWRPVCKPASTADQCPPPNIDHRSVPATSRSSSRNAGELVVTFGAVSVKILVEIPRLLTPKD